MERCHMTSLCKWPVCERQTKDLRHVREPKTVLDSGFYAVDSGFQVLDFSLCQRNSDSEFHSLVGFRIP